MIAALLLLGADPSAMIARAATLTRPAATRPAHDRGTRWRIADDADLGPDAKSRAVETTGAPCDVVGARRCTRKPRTILSAPLGN